MSTQTNDDDPDHLNPVVDHELKTWPVAYEQIRRGNKTHEYRKNDRGYLEGQSVCLLEYEPDKGYTGRYSVGTIGPISYGPEWGIPEGYCVFSFHRQYNYAPGLYTKEAREMFDE